MSPDHEVYFPQLIQIKYKSAKSGADLINISEVIKL